MKSYNGYTPHQRLAAYRWLQTEYAAGRRRAPKVCDACSQTEGPIEAHSEDYSKPYGPHIGAYGLCWTCHMIVHCRFSAPDAWHAYRQAVRAGAIFKPFHDRQFSVFSAMFLREGLPGPERWREPVAQTVLDQIEAARGQRRTALLPPP